MCRKLSLDDLADLIPFSTGKSGANSWHMDRGTNLLRKDRYALESFANGFITDRRYIVVRTDIVLADQIGNPKLLINFDKLDSAQGKRQWFVTAIPSAIAALWF